MQKRYIRNGFWGALSFITLVFICSLSVSADTTRSTHYTVNGAQFDSGATAHSCSSTYCSQQSLGDTGAGSASSQNYGLSFESDPKRTALIEVETVSGLQNLGNLDVTSTSATESLLKIKDYSTAGYFVQLSGPPPGQGTHEIDPLTSPTSSHKGAEQFGINLVANTDPVIGSAPIQSSTNQANYGLPTDNYNTPNLFMYQNGDTIAENRAGNGETDYTISMIINVSNGTPIGHYQGIFSAIVIPLY
jgi:hypothetical protein